MHGCGRSSRFAWPIVKTPGSSNRTEATRSSSPESDHDPARGWNARDDDAPRASPARPLARASPLLRPKRPGFPGPCSSRRSARQRAVLRAGARDRPTGHSRRTDSRQRRCRRAVEQPRSGRRLRRRVSARLMRASPRARPAGRWPESRRGRPAESRQSSSPVRPLPTCVGGRPCARWSAVKTTARPPSPTAGVLAMSSLVPGPGAPANRRVQLVAPPRSASARFP